MAIELLCPRVGAQINGSILALPAPFPLPLLVCCCNLRQMLNHTLHQSSNPKDKTKALDISAYDQHHGLYTNDRLYASYAGRTASTWSQR